MSYPPASGPSYTPDPYSSGSASQAGYQDQYSGAAYQDQYSGTSYQDQYPGAAYQDQYPGTSYQPPDVQGFFSPPVPGPGAPAVKSRTAPTILLVSGLVLCLLSAGIFIAALVKVMNIASSMVEVAPNGTVHAELQGASAYGLYGNGTSSCVITDPDGVSLEVVSDASLYGTINDQALFGAFTTTVGGNHEITCTTVGAEQVYIGHIIGAQSVLGGVAAILLSLGAGIIGVPLLTAGVIWLVVRSKNNKKVLQARLAASYSGSYSGGVGQTAAF